MCLLVFKCTSVLKTHTIFLQHRAQPPQFLDRNKFQNLLPDSDELHPDPNPPFPPCEVWQRATVFKRGWPFALLEMTNSEVSDLFPITTCRQARDRPSSASLACPECGSNLGISSSMSTEQFFIVRDTVPYGRGSLSLSCHYALNSTHSYSNFLQKEACDMDTARRGGWGHSTAASASPTRQAGNEKTSLSSLGLPEHITGRGECRCSSMPDVCGLLGLLHSLACSI